MNLHRSNLNRSVLLALGLLAACAPQKIRADVGAVFTRLQGDIALQNGAGNLDLGSNMNDVHDQLGIGERDESPMVRLEADWGPNRVKLSGFTYNAAGGGTVGGGTGYGDLPAGTSVFTDFDFVDITGSWSYDLMPTPMFRVAPGVQLGYYSLDIITRGPGPAFESVDTDLIAPQIYLDTEVDLGYLSVGANAGLIAIDLGDANGRYWDAEAYVRGQIAPHIEVSGGVRYLLFDARGTASDRDFDADVDMFGWYLTAGVTF